MICKFPVVLILHRFFPLKSNVTNSATVWHINFLSLVRIITQIYIPEGEILYPIRCSSNNKIHCVWMLICIKHVICLSKANNFIVYHQHFWITEIKSSYFVNIQEMKISSYKQFVFPETIDLFVSEPWPTLCDYPFFTYFYMLLIFLSWYECCIACLRILWNEFYTWLRNIFS